MQIYCCECESFVEARETTGEEVYKNRPDLKDLVIYKCDTCSNYVGAHKDGTKKPLGSIPTPELRKARLLIHKNMDHLWKSGKISRRKLYGILSKAIGCTYHTGEIRTLKDSDKVLKLVDKLSLKYDNIRSVTLPINYEKASIRDRQKARYEYIKIQGGNCHYCKNHLSGKPGKDVERKNIDKSLFPKGFFENPIHLHHCHKTEMTIGAVHSWCNAVLWQYHGE